MIDAHMVGFEKEAIFSKALKECRKAHGTFKAKTLKSVLQIISPEFTEGLYVDRPCRRKLKFIGYENFGKDAPENDFDSYFIYGETYESAYFNGGSYQILGYEGRIGCDYFQVCG